MARSAEVESYLADAQRWDQDLVARAEASRRRAYWVASAFRGLAALTMVAFNVMLPLKSVEPFVIRVDNTTGVTDVVPVYVGKGEVAEAVTRYLLHNYVVTRERYFYAMAEQDYNLVGAYNSPVLNTLWMQSWDRANPESPLVNTRMGSTLRSQVQAISFIKRADGTQDLAQVRFLTASSRGARALRRSSTGSRPSNMATWRPPRMSSFAHSTRSDFESWNTVVSRKSWPIRRRRRPRHPRRLREQVHEILDVDDLHRMRALRTGFDSRLCRTLAGPRAGHPRVRVVAYDPEQVIKLHGFVGYQIHFQFAEGETFVNLAAGDNKALDVGYEANHLC